MKTDIQIPQEAVMEPITKVAESLQIKADELELYGKYKAKISDEYLAEIASGALTLLRQERERQPPAWGWDRLLDDLGKKL